MCQGGLGLEKGGLHLQQVGKLIKVALSAALESGPRTKVNVMSKEDVSEKKIKVARHFKNPYRPILFQH